jgi:hypothetical protein
MVGLSDAVPEVAEFELDPGHAGLTLELLQYVSPLGSGQAFPRLTWGTAHLSFVVVNQGTDLTATTCRSCRAQLGLDEDGDANRRLEALFVLSITLGLRSGELRTLTWDHVDLDRGVVHVWRPAPGIADHGSVQTGAWSSPGPREARGAWCRTARAGIGRRGAAGRVGTAGPGVLRADPSRRTRGAGCRSVPVLTTPRYALSPGRQPSGGRRIGVRAVVPRSALRPGAATYPPWYRALRGAGPGIRLLLPSAGRGCSRTWSGDIPPPALRPRGGPGAAMPSAKAGKHDHG